MAHLIEKKFLLFSLKFSIHEQVTRTNNPIFLSGRTWPRIPQRGSALFSDSPLQMYLSPGLTLLTPLEVPSRRSRMAGRQISFSLTLLLPLIPLL